ncbi:MAG: type II toxin-antitoxin system RelE/ParE family toxin [Rhizobacter sp.]|nr:type II toxin-antitoxin system RelE/ParE family toxin [Rhizobacter sp.]
MSYSVLLTPEAQNDLERLFEFVLEHEMARDDGDLSLAEEALSAIQAGMKVLERFPFTCRKAAGTPFLRELVIPFGHTGYVALFEVRDQQTVVVGAVRHQREDDYH